MATPIRQRLGFRFLAASFCLWSWAAWPATPWFARVWQTDDGLPGDNVTGVAQTRVGYLWIATQSGLARFDGVRLKKIRLPVGRPHPIIRAMLLDRKERLWLAEEGGVVVCLAGEEATMLTVTNGLSRLQAVEMVEGADQSVWISYVDGPVCRITGGKVDRVGDEEGLPNGGSCSLARDEANHLWLARAGQAGEIQNGRFESRLTLKDRNIQVQTARGKGIWICAGDTLLKYDAGPDAAAVARFPPEAANARATALFEDRVGAVWIGTAAHGLFRYDGTNMTQVETSHRKIRTITEDREANIWVGTDGGGLNRLRQQVVDLQGKEAGLPFDTVRSVCEDAAGTLWVVLQNGAVANSQNGEWKTISATAAWPGGQATCVASDTQGLVSIGTYSRGLYRWQNGQFATIRRGDGLANPSIRSMLADRAGNLWIAFSAGSTLQRFRDGKFQNYELPPNSRAIRAMAEDAAGRIWMANLEAQLLRVDGDRVVDETPGGPNSSRPIRCLAGTTDGSLWIGYSSAGVGRWKAGHFSRVGTERGLRDDSICAMMADDQGSIWFGSDHGIFRADERELAAVAEGKAPRVTCIGYGRDDGLPSVQGYYGYSPGAARSRDGRIFLPTHSGLAIVHPERVRTNAVAPQVVIESVVVDNFEVGDQGAEARKGATLLLPTGHRKLEITFTAPSFIDPEKVHFRYRLEGWDEGWLDTGAERNAVYSRLPAGHYQFRAKASNNAGVWNEAGASFGLVVEPFLWQTWWFQAGIGGFLAAVIFALARYVSLRRISFKVRRLEQENALQKERARIAQDIHDDLGARMTQISLLTTLAQQALPQPDKAGEHLTQIAEMSREGMKSLDEIVWVVNPRNDTLPDLLDYAGQYAVDFLRAAGIRCRVDFPSLPPGREVSAEVRHTLFLAVKEALNNVAKHAHATEVSLRAEITDDQLELVIEDNGQGFQQPAVGALADGLRNMRQRLAAIGGTCAIEGRPGTGARIRFEVPWAERGT